jgi:hypothetical protein
MAKLARNRSMDETWFVYILRCADGSLHSHRMEADKTNELCQRSPTRKGMPMNLRSWDVTINQIADESNLLQKDSDQQKVLFAWRERLAEAPTSLRPFQIDEIVREVRKRLVVASR